MSESLFAFLLILSIALAPANASTKASRTSSGASIDASSGTSTVAPLDAPLDAPSKVLAFPAEESLFQKYYRDLYSPFVNPDSLRIFGAGTLATLTLLATSNQFEDQVLEKASTERPLGRSSQFGDLAGQLVPNVLYFGYFGTSYLFTKDPTSRFRAELMLRATLAATTMSTFLKYTVREPRPESSSDLTSFPSGHSTSIFAFATTIAALHGPYWGGGAFALASFVAFSRMNDNRHRLHDVVAGATIGSMYGLSVYQRMSGLDNSKAQPNPVSRFEYQIVPVPTDDGAMLGLAGTF
jgi:membrane-associated phospholipid phosphatase